MYGIETSQAHFSKADFSLFNAKSIVHFWFDLTPKRIENGRILDHKS